MTKRLTGSQWAEFWKAREMGESTAPQAQPVEGRSFPTTARGARPTFDDDGAVENTSVPTGRVLQTGKQQKTGQLTLLVGQA